jgi:hypothetical protein
MFSAMNGIDTNQYSTIIRVRARAEGSGDLLQERQLYCRDRFIPLFFLLRCPGALFRA